MDIYGVEHRKKVASKYNLSEQEIIDLPREKFEIFVSGLEIGEKYGAQKVITAIRMDMEGRKECVENISDEREKELQDLEKEHLGDPIKKTGIYSEEVNNDNEQ